MPSYLKERHAVIQSFMPRPKRKAPLFRIFWGGQLPPCPPSSAATVAVAWRGSDGGAAMVDERGSTWSHILTTARSAARGNEHS